MNNPYNKQRAKKRQPCCQQYDKLLNLTPNILHLIPILRAFEEKAAKKIKRGHKKT